MPQFDYEATDPAGLQIRARLAASDAAEAVAQLRGQGLAVSRIEQVAEQTPASAAGAGGLFGGFVSELRNVAENISRELEKHADQVGKSRTPETPIICGWCETVHRPPFTEGNCPNCGGTLPLPAGPDRGPLPPPPPRHLPDKFVNSLLWASWQLWIGVVMLAIGLLLAPFTMCFTLIFAAVGGLMVWHHWTTANNRIEALRFGESTEGEVTFVGFDRSTKVNGRSPYKLEYRYRHENGWRTGQKISWNDQIAEHYAGEPVWVVHIPAVSG
ncbi:MAG: hypothetical protein WD030_04525, partial [Pirellulales bacterium]